MPIKENYRGKVKMVEVIDDEKVRIKFTNDITAGDGAKQDNIAGKGKLNLDLTMMLMGIIEKAGVPNHILSRESDSAILARNLDIIPIEVVVRNIVAGSYARRYGIDDGTPLDRPLVEYFVKDDDLHDPVIGGEIAIAQNLVSREHLSLIRTHALQANTVLHQIFKDAGMNLIDFKLEFGIDVHGNVYLGDELSPDAMRVWDIETNEKLDKDRFRKDLGDVMTGYGEILARLKELDVEVQPVPIVATISIMPKEGVTNPSGEVTKRAMLNSGMDDLGKVVIGKSITVELTSPHGIAWQEKLQDVTVNLLSNPLIEQFSIEYDIAEL